MAVDGQEEARGGTVVTFVQEEEECNTSSDDEAGDGPDGLSSGLCQMLIARGGPFDH